MRDAWAIIIGILLLAIIFVAAYNAGARNAGASDEYTATVFTIASNAEAENPAPTPVLPTPTATPTMVPPTPTPPVATAPQPLVRSGCPPLIVEMFGVNAPAACEVAWCESRFDQYAVGAAGERSWMQVHPIHGYPGWSFDPVSHVTFAYELSKGGSDWSHWSCKPW